MGVNWMGKHPNAGWNGPWTVNGALTAGAATLASAVVTGALGAAGVTTSGYFKVGNVASKTGTAPVLTVNDVVMLFNGATQASVLPSASAMSGYVIFLKNIGTGTATITGSATETIDGAAGTVALTPMKGVTLYSNGTSWYKLASI